MAKRMMTVPCFPCTVCEDCGGYLSWWHREDQPQEEAWLECPKCHRTWQADKIGYSVLDQFKAVNGMMEGIQGITDIALSRLEEPKPSLSTRLGNAISDFFRLVEAALEEKSIDELR